QVVDPRNPGLTYSNFDMRHRLVGSLMWSSEWRRGYGFGATLYYSGVSGSPFTYTYIHDLNRDGSSNKQMIYVPPDETDARIVPAAGDTRTVDQIWQQLDSFIQSQPSLRDHRGQIVPRNAGRTPWNHEVDLKLFQNVPMIGTETNRVQLTLD